MMKTNIALELLDLLEQQKELTEKKDDLIIKLVKDNAEKENMIKVLMTERRD